jgi:hypothetical protein
MSRVSVRVDTSLMHNPNPNSTDTGPLIPTYIEWCNSGPSLLSTPKVPLEVSTSPRRGGMVDACVLLARHCGARPTPSNSKGVTRQDGANNSLCTLWVDFLNLAWVF